MNILAEEQKKLFDAKLSAEELGELKEQFLKLYYKLRAQNEKSFFGKMSLKTRKRIHWIILLIYIIKNRLGGFSYELIADKRKKAGKPIIFAVSHVGKFDIEVISEAIKDHYYLLSGDFEHIQGIIDAPFIAANGVIYFNEFVKDDRKLATKKMIAHLCAGGNLMYFPEGTWNMSPNLPMLPCYWGIVEVAQKSNAVIIPIAADQYGKKFKVNIGENFDVNKYGDTNEEKTKAISDLRDKMASLKWEIWETEFQKRCELIGDEWNEYCKERFKEWPYFNLEYINRMIFKPKGVIENDEAFAHILYLEPNMNNAFLFNKRLK